MPQSPAVGCLVGHNSINVKLDPSIKFGFGLIDLVDWTGLAVLILWGGLTKKASLFLTAGLLLT